MIVKFAKWGNPIPHWLAKELKARDGSQADLTIEKGKLIVAPIATAANDLDRFLGRITPENPHGETRSGRAVGNEF